MGAGEDLDFSDLKKKKKKSSKKAALDLEAFEKELNESKSKDADEDDGGGAQPMTWPFGRACASICACLVPRKRFTSSWGVNPGRIFISLRTLVSGVGKVMTGVIA